MKVSSGLNAVIALRYGLRGYFAFLTLWNTHFHRSKHASRAVHAMRYFCCTAASALALASARAVL